MKFLTGATITGADDKVPHRELQELSLEFPFVEWGILLSAKKAGTARYPNMLWAAGLRELGAHKAVHLCGQYARNRGASGLAAVTNSQRMQLNGLTDYKQAVSAAIWDAGRPEYILQVRTLSAFNAARSAAFKISDLGGKASLLWDPSGGKGIYAKPEPMEHGQVPIGYAGGISPRNIHEVLESLKDGGPCWIDMESGVRTDDEFDLVKVRSVLDLARPYVLEA